MIYFHFIVLQFKEAIKRVSDCASALNCYLKHAQ